ncbi:hypothetical protein [Sphingomonas sp.]|uniref:hypothetical protein n=1 Tax=Sphingomonas sp. TaxID=28214 RepID=UPI002DD69CD9|nr:hypothetical protein [Sphingomonas sp.]
MLDEIKLSDIVSLLSFIATLIVSIVVLLQTRAQNRRSNTISAANFDQQAQILRINLLERRLTLYQQFRSLYGKITTHSNVSTEDIFEAARIAQSSKFIFDKTVTEFLKNFKNNLNNFNFYNEKFNSATNHRDRIKFANSSSDFLKRILDAHGESDRVFQDAMAIRES